MERKNVWILSFFSSLLITVFASCTRDVQSQKYATGIDMGQYRTYAWLPSGDTLWNDFHKDAEVADQIMKEVDKELGDVGYKLDPENPDFLVLVHTNYKKQKEGQRLPSSYSYYGPNFYNSTWYNSYYPYYNSIGYLQGPYVEDVEYTQGTIVVDIIDAETKQIVWRGTSSDAVYDDELTEEMAEEVDHIFKEFPVSDI